MFSRRWDPGIWEVYEDWICKSFANLRWFDLGRWNLGKTWRGSGISASSRKGNHDGTDVEIIWGLWNKEREGRDYYGKGKGKMVEESEFKWTKVPERGNKRAYTNRGNYRGEGDASRHRSARREDTRFGAQNEQAREQQGKRGVREEAQEEKRLGVQGPGGGKQWPGGRRSGLCGRGARPGGRGDGDTSRYRPARRDDTRSGIQNEQGREQQGNRVVREETREEGEIRNAEEQVAIVPSQKFQEELAKTQADGTEVISDPTDAEQGLVTVQGMLEEQGELDDEDVMDMDEIKAHLLENEIDMDAEDFMENLSEEEAEEVIKESKGKEEEEVVAVEEEQGQVGGEVGKKQGLRKRLFKPTLSTVGSSKMRVFNAGVSKEMSWS
ncbi:hypothetical protein F2Q70_00003528 [Brassica cretica]|uniref:Uncharacterized protein n=2 Tax=Brassica cretica TaxID=69181 RepID=A0A8S9J021_BRACR|nr:hypothetical protein F2Q70_00003528 [Brassica cretica]